MRTTLALAALATPVLVLATALPAAAEAPIETEPRGTIETEPRGGIETEPRGPIETEPRAGVIETEPS